MRIPFPTSLFIKLPLLFDVAEITQNWSIPLAKLKGLAKAGHLDVLPDWLAVEIIWMAVQFEQKLQQLEQPAQKMAVKKSVGVLKKLVCWQQVIDFDQHFPLLDKYYLHSQGVTSDIKCLSQFLANPNSKQLSPHPLFNNIRYNSLESLTQSNHHPLVHFFRHSSNSHTTSANPNLFFDCDWYRENYLSNSVHQHPLLHYVSHFQQTDIQPSLHFYNNYIRETQQLAADVDPLSYYLAALADKSHGFCREGFSPCPYFDRTYYLGRYPDINVAIENDPFDHFVSFGIKEGRHAHVWLRHEMFVPTMISGFRAKKRVAVLILGMHRSGTSALTRVINLLGMEVSTHLMEANFANETGYWESVELAQLHDQILFSCNSAWDDDLSIEPQYFQSEEMRRYEVALEHYIVREFYRSDCFALKDPRLCKLVPLWLKILGNLNIQTKIIIPFRNPLEIAESLNARDGFSQEKSFLLWLRHVLEVEYHTRGLDRCFVNYADLLTQHRKVIDNIATRCQINWPNDSEETEEQITQFLNPAYYHQRIDGNKLEDMDVPDWVLQTYSVLKRLSALTVDEQECSNKLDGISKEIAQADKLHGKIIAEKQRDLQHLFTITLQKNAQLQQLLQQNSELEQLAYQNHLR